MHRHKHRCAPPEAAPTNTEETIFATVLPGEGAIQKPQQKRIRQLSIVLDDYLEPQEIDRVTLLKMDLEGQELNRLRGLSKAFSRGAIEVKYFGVRSEILRRYDVFPEPDFPFPVRERVCEPEGISTVCQAHSIELSRCYRCAFETDEWSFCKAPENAPSIRLKIRFKKDACLRGLDRDHVLSILLMKVTTAFSLSRTVHSARGKGLILHAS